MKKIISLLALMLALSAGYVSAEISDVKVINGSIDRKFDKDRTLYYVEQVSEEIPEITAEGATAVKVVTNLNELTERVTVLKDNETGKEYRFVIMPKNAEAEIKSFTISEKGSLSISYSSPDSGYVNLMILKPVSDSSEQAYNISDVDGEDDLLKVYDIINLSENEGTYECQLPEDTICGMYRVVLGGDKILEKPNLTTYYISTVKLESVLEELNELDASVDAIDNFIKKYALMINIDKNTYDEVSDKSLFVKFLTGKDFSDLDEVMKNYNIAKTLSEINASDEKNVIDIIMKNKEMLSVNTDVFDEIDNIAAVAKLIKKEKYDEVEKLKKSFDKAVAVIYINEAEPSEIEERFEKVFDTLVEDANIKASYEKSKNKTKILKSLLNQNFSDSNAFERELKDAIDESEKTKPQGSSGGGGGGTGSSMPYIPAVKDEDIKPEPEEEKITETKEMLYDDIEDTEWAREAIMLLSDRKVVNGKAYKKFAPNDYVTREEFVKMLCLALELESNNSDNPFKDVSESDWYYQYILIGAGNKVIAGKSEDHFGVGENITREDMAVMITRAMNAAKFTVTDVINNLYYELEFEDVEEISDYAKESVKSLVKKGIISGMGNNTFSPKSNATRAQAAQMIYKVIKDK